MNKKLRQEIFKIYGQIDALVGRLEEIAEDEEYKVGNMEDYFPDTQRTEDMREGCDLFTDIVEEIRTSIDRITEEEF